MYVRGTRRGAGGEVLRYLYSPVLNVGGPFTVG